MAKYEWSEIFMSIEGEARYSGHPTVYIRFARCNFKCALFNNVNKNIEKDGYATLEFNPEDYNNLNNIPLIHKGCDSQYAVNPRFAHMWHTGNEKELAAEVLKVLPHNTFKNPETGKRIILSFTGGEPTIRLKFWIPILEELYANEMRTILIETNAAVPLRPKDITSLYEWVSEKNNDVYEEDSVVIVWSNSPKLSISGECWDCAVRPEIVMQQRDTDLYFEQYFKFVCGPTETDFNEVAKAMEQYYQGGISRNVDVYIMPVACTEEQQQEISSRVAKLCINRGYIYCHRIQNSVFGNGVGT